MCSSDLENVSITCNPKHLFENESDKQRKCFKLQAWVTQESEFSKLLGQAISSIIEVKAENDIDSFLDGGQVSFLENDIKGLNDFELICFLVVR